MKKEETSIGCDISEHDLKMEMVHLKEDLDNLDIPPEDLHLIDQSEEMLKHLSPRSRSIAMMEQYKNIIANRLLLISAFTAIFFPFLFLFILPIVIGGYVSLILHKPTYSHVRIQSNGIESSGRRHLGSGSRSGTKSSHSSKSEVGWG